MRKAIFIFIFFHSAIHLSSQIPAAAQGGDIASWIALGNEQALSAKWQLNTSLGSGRHDTPGSADNNLFKHQGIFNLKQSFKYNYKQSFISLGYGYWRRNYYDSANEYYRASETPYTCRNELRSFSIIGHSFKLSNSKLSFSFRPEARYFYDQYFKSRWATPFEFRARWLSSYTFPILSTKNNSITISAEQFFATDKTLDEGKPKWTSLQLTDMRVFLFYKHAIIPEKLDIDFGIMNQIFRQKMGNPTFSMTNTFMLDLILKDVFSKKIKAQS